MSNQDEMWLDRKSVSQEISSSVTAPFSVLAEHPKSKLPFKSFKIGISSHSLFLKSLAYIYLCVYIHTQILLTHTHTHIYKVYLYYMVFISQQPPNRIFFLLLPVSLSHTAPLSLAASPPIQTTSCLACTAPWDFLD